VPDFQSSAQPWRFIKVVLRAGRAARGGSERRFAVASRYLPARMIIALVLLWLLLGLGVFFIAMRGGPRGARAALHTETVIGQRMVMLMVVIVVAFGVAVPTIVLAFNGEHKASVAAGGTRLTASEQRGRDLFARACAVCHTLAASKAVGRIGPNLDVRVGDGIQKESGRRALVLNAIQEGRARGLGQMPAQLYQGREAEEVAEFVAAAAGRR
jgi:mono/diheme cytochrome c family protein